MASIIQDYGSCPGCDAPAFITITSGPKRASDGVRDDVKAKKKRFQLKQRNRMIDIYADSLAAAAEQIPFGAIVTLKVWCT